MKPQPHGVWLFFERRPFDDRRIWIEKIGGGCAPTPFNPAPGLKHDESR